jgi:hypothetical protein
MYILSVKNDYPLVIKRGLLENSPFSSMIFTFKHPFSAGIFQLATIDYQGNDFSMGYIALCHHFCWLKNIFAQWLVQNCSSFQMINVVNPKTNKNNTININGCHKQFPNGR